MTYSSFVMSGLVANVCLYVCIHLICLKHVINVYRYGHFNFDVLY